MSRGARPESSNEEEQELASPDQRGRHGFCRESERERDDEERRERERNQKVQRQMND